MDYELWWHDSFDQACPFGFARLGTYLILFKFFFFFQLFQNYFIVFYNIVS